MIIKLRPLCGMLMILIAICNLSFGQNNLVNHLENIFYNSSFMVFPQKVFPASDYGEVGDGKKIISHAVQMAIDAANEARGGIVTLPKGENLSGAIFIKSDVELRIDSGVILKAIHDDTQYQKKWTRIAGIEMNWPAALIKVYEQENVRLTGGGVIDGSGN